MKRFGEYFCRVLLSGVLAYAGIVKLLDPNDFLSAVLSFRVLSGLPAGVATYWIPALEVILAVALWIPRYRLVAAAASTLLLVAFTVLIGVAWVRGIDLTCGCFGKVSEGSANYPFLLIRDLVLALLAAWLWKIAHSGFSREEDR
ncbi:MauE/DoxX family redox-associated membrane protein [Puniceicoccus vermicola]|uniref:Methylamine utilisation protein MauE domain-containing protein n=1 Tax=Puniceicoccus vermicola TaxID=388746 RepID=A0A7X1B024_9BACT|nr:hypothetical protein [Puniceicoccus vermicola]